MFSKALVIFQGSSSQTNIGKEKKKTFFNFEYFKITNNIQNYLINKVRFLQILFHFPIV
jgi:hypothetical protein